MASDQGQKLSSIDENPIPQPEDPVYSSEEEATRDTANEESKEEKIPQDFMAKMNTKVSKEEKIPQDFMEKVKTKVSKAITKRPPEPPTICEVPGDLTDGNKGAYTPKVVCIGPLFDSHRSTASMLRLEKYKWCCVRKLIVGRQRHVAATRWSPEVHEPLLLECFRKMMRLVPRVRAAYSTISSSSSSSNDDVLALGGTSDEQLAMKMLLDGCFVLRRLLKFDRVAKLGSSNNVVKDRRDEDELDEWSQMMGRCWVWGTVKRDLLLLSNQVPFFVLRKLSKHLSNTGNGGDLVNGGLQLLSSLYPRRLNSAPIACKGVHHLLHLYYLSIDFPRDLETPNRPNEPLLLEPEAELTWWLPCAKELEEAGVVFIPRTREQGATSFLDVRFQGGNLEIPPLQLYDYSEPLFRNLIAFEQTYPGTPGRITAYFIFMDCLLKTAKDVRLLHQSGVLVNHMNGDRADTAVEFFSRLCAEVHTSANRNYLAGVMEDVARFQRGSWPRWRVALVSGYLTNPWVITSVVAAAVVLALTVLQSYYSVASYYK
ncbi:UPF0481 protein At3g47200 isoform X2 [Brachypodium distachyon]|uniref:Uncharacterized protein n=1 Tax=Brachypodium distachyon TaxID=15368 RepID=I1IFX2_BRADI|nr:UPF0481 protein At3g47200 isoform X2 [Brachypodium distachyon]KQK02217.1 hypothetical protein BRADI_3g61070v3 [Brachypodium distachyon]|eukprot:XP_003570749.1 UPF0481 protein At3g47200 isoform X2 [Brachypodium distachyon]